MLRWSFRSNIALRYAFLSRPEFELRHICEPFLVDAPGRELSIQNVLRGHFRPCALVFGTLAPNHRQQAKKLHNAVDSLAIQSLFALLVQIHGHRSNNNPLVFQTLDAAIARNPGAKPLLHSDRGFQDTSKVFGAKRNVAGIAQSMSRAGRCIDSGPMEGFWGILKTGMCYRQKFHSFEQLKEAVDAYIQFYTTERLQGRLGCRSPMEYHLLHSSVRKHRGFLVGYL